MVQVVNALDIIIIIYTVPRSTSEQAEWPQKISMVTQGGALEVDKEEDQVESTGL